MNKILCSIIMFFVLAFAINFVFGRARIQFISSSATVSISSDTWTAFPSTTTIDTSRSGIIFDSKNPSSLGFRILLSTTNDPAPTDAITAGFEYLGTDIWLDLAISGFVYAWAISTDTANATQDMWVAEYRDER